MLKEMLQVIVVVLLVVVLVALLLLGNAEKLNGKAGSEYILKNNIAVITGTIENVSGNSEVTKTIAYPEGFDENSAAISLGIGRKDTELNYGQAIQDSGAMFNGNPVHYVNLTSSGIVLHAFYNIEGMSTGQTLNYKIILMKTE